MTEKKKDRWLLPASLVVILAVVAAVMIFAVTRSQPLPTPYEAMRKALNSLEPLPDPVTLGVLGQGEMGGERFGVSGNLDLQTGKDGLELSLTDFTLGYEEGSTDFEVYINRETAAARIPELLGDTWYGVDLDRDLEAQAIEAAGEELVDWYFDDGGLSQAQATVSKLREMLGGVERIGLSDSEIQELKDFLSNAPAELDQDEDGYTVTFDVSSRPSYKLWGLDIFAVDGSVPKDAAVILRLDREQRLTAVEVSATGFYLYTLDLGDPDEPTPRLELHRPDGLELELAFTVSEGTAFTAPKFTNAFDLLNLLSLGE